MQKHFLQMIALYRIAQCCVCCIFRGRQDKLWWRRRWYRSDE